MSLYSQKIISVVIVFIDSMLNNITNDKCNQSNKLGSNNQQYSEIIRSVEFLTNIHYTDHWITVLFLSSASSGYYDTSDTDSKKGNDHDGDGYSFQEKFVPFSMIS